MPAPRPIFVMEFNELCPPLLTRWMAEGKLPGFARLAARSDRFTTLADAPEGVHLEPWIQWYSAHTGLAWDQHGVFHLTDGPRADHADIYRTMIAAGRRVSSFASMNVKPFAGAGQVFAGDPWSENGDASPAELNVYNAFVSRNVREYSNAANQPGLADYAKFLKFMALSGLKPTTVVRILEQLATEKLKDRRLTYRRATLLDALQFDVFAHYTDRHRPHFATFFLNSTAHLQHSYWRHMEPGAFQVRPGADELGVYGDAVLFGYQSMDRLIGRFEALAARHDARIVFMTALSQQPFLNHEETGGQHFYRLHDVEAFLGSLGIAFAHVDPTMTHQYLATFASPADEAAARQRLAALRLDGGRALFDFGRQSIEGLYFGCQIATMVGPGAVVIDDAGGGTLRFGDILYKIDAIKSGRHHPEGALWFDSGRGRAHAGQVSILDVMPTFLDLAGVAMPAGPHRGRSLAAMLDDDAAVLPRAA